MHSNSKKYTFRIRRILSFFAVFVLLSFMLSLAFAQTEPKVCKNHPVHDLTCGYSETVPASECTHAHGSCGYIEPKKEVACSHKHNSECGYKEAVSEIPCSLGCEVRDEETGEIIHLPDCEYRAAIPEAPCNHVHHEICEYKEAVAEIPCDRGCDTVDEETGAVIHSPDCIYTPAIPETSCGHIHNENCGFTEAVLEIPCNLECDTIDEETGEIRHLPECEFAPSKPETPCKHEHLKDCGFAEEVKGSPCIHEHDEACGYHEAIDAKPCRHSCRLCNPVKYGVNGIGYKIHSQVEKKADDIFTLYFDITDSDEINEVTITETLSQYVDLVSPSVFSIKITDAGGNTSDLNASNYIAPAVTPDGKTITLAFRSSYILLPNHIYTFSFDVKVNRTAYDYYDHIGSYPDNGEENTDRQGYDGSSGKPGFSPSFEANVSYKYVSSGEQKSDIFPYPVVQINPANIEPQPQAGDPAYKKQIKYNGNDNYRISLDIAGIAKTVSNPLDVILVIDNSYSMRNTTLSGSGTNYRAALSSLLMGTNGLVNNILNANSASRFKVIVYNSTANTAAGSWTRNTSTITNAIATNHNSSSAYYFTNYQQALTNTSAQLDGSTNQKIVLFVSDGVPSAYHNTSNAVRYTGRNSSGTLSETGTASTTNTPYNYTYTSIGTATNTAISNIRTEHPDAKIYSIGINQSNTYLSSVAFNGGTFTNVTTNTTLSTALSNISNAVTSSVEGQREVSITDILSPYVDLCPNPNFKVTVKPSAGTETNVNGNDFTVDVSPDLKTITCKFDDNFIFDVGSTYSLSFDIKVSQFAYNQFSTDGYIHTGHQGTDASGNSTSSGMPGFFSNINATAVYQHGANGTPATLTYKRPVVQLEREETNVTECLLEHNKTIDYLGDDDDNDDTNLEGNEYYRIYLDATTKEAGNGIDLVLVLDKSSSMVNASSYDLGVANRTRLEVMNRILKGEFIDEPELADGFIARFLKANPNNRISVVYFGGYQHSGTSWGGNIPFTNWQNDGEIRHNFTNKASSMAEIQSNIASVESSLLALGDVPTSGTNYGAGLLYANQLLNLSNVVNDGNEKYVMFLSDGEPTYYITTTSTGSTVPTFGQIGTSYRRANGGTQTSDADTCRAPNATLATNFRNANPNATVSTIAITGASSYDFTVLRTLTSPEGYFESSASSTQLEEGIFKMLDSQLITDLKITDRLSKYVNLYNQPEYRVTETNTSGVVTDVDPDNYALTYDNPTKTISLLFNNRQVFNSQNKYTLSFNVQVTPEAYKEYSSNGYNASGEPGTNYGANSTSDYNYGFRTNDASTVSYSFDGEEFTERYDFPVAQVGLYSFNFRKIDSSSKAALEGAEFDLYMCGHEHTSECGGRVDPLNCNHEHSEVVTPDLNSCWTFITSVSSDEFGNVDFGILDDGVYMLAETQAPGGYRTPIGQWYLQVSGHDPNPANRLIITAKGDVLPPAFLRKENDDETYSYDLPNFRDLQMPLSGGKGTQLFIYIGGALIVLSISIFIIHEIRNKKNKNKNSSDKERGDVQRE